jgi:hypothetical protein
MSPFFEQLWRAVTRGMMSWYEVKMFIEHASVVNSDGLHVLFGVVVWILIALLLRRPVTAPAPLLILLGLVAFNELVDLWVEQWPDKAMQYGESAKDILLTMTLPLLLMVLAARVPRLFGGRASGSRRGPGGRSRRL